MYDVKISKEELASLLISEKRRILCYGIKNYNFYEEHDYKINCDYLKFNMMDECDREVAVSYFPMLPLLNSTVSLGEADYIIYGHFYARFHHFRDYVKKEIEELVRRRKAGAKIIVVGKSCNIKPYLDESVKDIIYFEHNYAEKLGQYFDLPIKEEYFVYEKRTNMLNIWPVDGCNCKCGFCRRTYMHIPFASLPLDYIAEKLNWYRKHEPHKMQKVMLRAENLTEYGIDIYGKQALHELINLLNSYDEIKELHIYIGLAIGEMSEDIIESLCQCNKLVMATLNIEAGTDRLLTLINKKHTVAKAREVFARLREAHPNMYLNTNVMLGLPTENIEDIICLADLINEISVDDLHILRYVMNDDQPLSEYSETSPQLYYYHLKLLLTLLKRSSRTKPLIIDCEYIKSKQRIYVRTQEKLDKMIEERRKLGLETVCRQRRILRLPAGGSNK